MPENPRKWLGVQFDCCGVYVRAWQNAEGNLYQAACPRCGKQVRFAVGKGGTESRFFRAE